MTPRLLAFSSHGAPVFVFRKLSLVFFLFIAEEGSCPPKAGPPSAETLIVPTNVGLKIAEGGS